MRDFFVGLIIVLIFVFVALSTYAPAALDQLMAAIF